MSSSTPRTTQVWESRKNFVPEELYSMAERHSVWKEKKEQSRGSGGGGGRGGGRFGGGGGGGGRFGGNNRRW